MVTTLSLLSVLACVAAPRAATLAAAQAPAPDPDRDGDGLSDFQELHKYGTDPARADSDGDGVPDGDWNERREYAYSVRSLVDVAPPVTADVLCDDYQDARILEQTAEYVQLEVIHYPLNTVAEAVAADTDWRAHTAGMQEWIRPGPTANWDAELRARLLADLRGAGIDPEALDDKTLVERASHWLLQHAHYQDGFSTFCSEFVDGQARIFPGLEQTALEAAAQQGLSVAEQWQRELFAKGMYQNGMRGSCTSSAIYLDGCLRALGIPTRVILTIPLVDSSDERELAMLARLQHHGVRATLQQALRPLGSSWSSHTYNEVFVGGRWRRLNYDRLGQNILDAQFFGLMTHVATFSDWADGHMAATWGLREAHQDSGDVFGGSNPYSAIAVSDQFGAHATVENPPLAEAPSELTILGLLWSDAPGCPLGDLKLDPPVLLAHVGPDSGFPAYKRFTELTDRRFFLEAEGQATLQVESGVGGITGGGESYIPIPLGGADWAALVPGIAYELRPQNSDPAHLWRLARPLSVQR